LNEKKIFQQPTANILPTAQELKENGKVLAKNNELATVLFTDFEGFTNYSENLPPEKLVESI
jgi:class 3 adenylate cyclase